MATIYGLDFGTTNSLASIVLGGKVISFVEEADQLPHPSVIQYRGSETIVGREAKQAMDSTGSGVIGDVVRSPKRYLGSGEKVFVGGVGRDVSDIVADVLRHIRSDACSRKIVDNSFDRAVVTIPVNANGRARRDLREAALRAGIHVHQFVQEPFAALYGYIRTLPDYRRRLAELEGQLILVFDWGGGTLDLTLCKISKGTLAQIQSKGDDTVGGDRFDDRLIRHVKKQHMVRHGLDSLGNELPHADAKLIGQCETAKIALSERQAATVAVAHYLRADGESRTLEERVTRDQLIGLTKDIVDSAMENIDELLESAGVNEASLALCLATGGMVRMPYIRERLLERFDPARVPKIENGDRIISEGAAWIAYDRARLRLAKPFELLLGDDNYTTLIPEDSDLPIENEIAPFCFEAYCVDPRDGYGKFHFARPLWPGRNLPGDPRRPYATLLVAVDEKAVPLTERLKISVDIDHDLIATTMVCSTMVGHQSSREIHNLEFGLYVGGEVVSVPYDSEQQKGQLPVLPYGRDKGSIKLRSNVVRSPSAWELVPGDFVGRFKRSLSPNWRETPRQHWEKMYYIPCSLCGRNLHRIQIEGDEHCPCAIGGICEADANTRKERMHELRELIKAQEVRLNDGR